MTVSNGRRSEDVLLHREVEDEYYYVPGDLTPEQQSDALDADASEAVAIEAGEVLRALGYTWPRCPEHGEELGACTGVWYCNGPPYHDVAEIGSLGGDVKRRLHLPGLGT